MLTALHVFSAHTVDKLLEGNIIHEATHNKSRVHGALDGVRDSYSGRHVSDKAVHIANLEDEAPVRTAELYEILYSCTSR